MTRQDTQTPPCPHFSLCGGCTYQHLTSESYEKTKIDLLKGALKSHGLENLSLGVPVFLPPRTRRRITLKGFKIGKRIILGYLKRKSHDLVDIRTCLIARPELGALFDPLRSLLSFLLKDRQKVEISLTLAREGIDVGIKGLRESELTLEDRETLAAFGTQNDVARISIFSETSWMPVLVNAVPTVLFGSYPITLSPAAFLQASPEADQILFSKVLEGLHNSPHQIIDLFCGRGTFSLPLSEKTPVIAVDADADALKALSETVRKYARPITVCYRNLFNDPLSEEELKKADVVILNPPRDGAFAQVKTLAYSTVKTIVMVSCNPLTLARDLKILLDKGGYRLQLITPVDQFVWSTHLESVAVLQKS